MSGFFHADAIWFTQDDASLAVVGDAEDVSDFRRARLAAGGSVADNIDYFMEYDFGFPGRPSFMDVFLDVDLEQTGGVGRLRIGQWRQPLGMDALTSVKELTFLERALPFALLPFRQIGVGIYDTTANERVTWAVSGYRFRTDLFGSVSGDEGYGFSTRETFLLYEGPCSTIHLGAGYTYNRTDNNVIRLRSPPEVGFNELDFYSPATPVPFFVDTGALAGDTYQVFNVELAGSRGPLLAQAEYTAAVAGLDATGDASFNGGYAQVSYILTGESRPYHKASGVYGRVTPYRDFGPHGAGGWEVATRWSFLDLTDGAIDGGVIDTLSFGLNWYLNRHTKFQFNYIHAFLERPSGVDSDTDVFAMRAQLDF